MCSPSISSALVKPDSISFIASSGVFATLQVNSSFCSRNSAFSRLMYIMVDDMFLCPSMVFTCMMSLVLWYSVVPFQCLKVCGCICRSLGLLNFLKALRFSLSSVTCSPCVLVGKTLWVLCGIWFSMFMSLSEIGSILLLLPFSAVM